MSVLYSAVNRFDPSCGEAWENWLAWSGLTQVREVISIDYHLCPFVFGDISEEDWNHNVHESNLLNYFRDLDYLLGKTTGIDRISVLALLQNPTDVEVRSFNDPRFMFCGFDLMELWTGISALTNCGGVFPKAFAPTQLSEYGLLSNHTEAFAVQRRLRIEYPDEHHADCDVWAIWRLDRTSPD